MDLVPIMKKMPFIRKEVYKRSECLFFEDLVTMMVSLSSLLFTEELIKTKNSALLLKEDEDSLNQKLQIPFQGQTIKETYAYEAYTPLKKVVDNRQVDELVFNIHEFTDMRTSLLANPDVYFVEHPHHIHQRMIGAAYVNFFEASKAAIESKFLGNKANWPGVLNFARVIRNAYSHGGKIHFTSPNAAPVSWQGLTYSSLDNGKSIYSDIFLVEVIHLMNAIAQQLV